MEFMVHDTGIGIPPAKHAEIFSAFSQADGLVTRKYGGTGLGLTISKQLVEMMGGRLRVESEEGKGSRFIFQVWLRAAAEPEDVSRQEANLKDLPVLVVDDIATNRHVISLMLERLHILHHDQADSGQMALEMLDQAHQAGNPYRLVLLDARMPGLDGFAVAERLRNDPRHDQTALLMLTSSGMRGDSQRCMDLGLEAYLTKPVTLMELRHAMETTLVRPPTDGRIVTRHTLREERAMNPPLHILLAEDNIVNQKLAIKLLEKQDHLVSLAENGRLAIEAWQAGIAGKAPFDLILMDMMMPDMDGLEATRRIREMEQDTGGHIPIIAMTANAMQGDKERCLEAGMDGYISKPVKPETLYGEIHRFISVQPTSGKAPGDTPAPPPTSKKETELPIYDRAEALSRIADDEDLLNTLIEMFQSDAPNYLHEIESALTAGDMPKLAHAVHTLKGVLATFSARRSEALAKEFERCAKEGDSATCATLMAPFVAEVDTFLRVLD
jgi:CheY-like chemotaxis protein